MSAIAQFLHDKGNTVFGYDQSNNRIIEILINKGIDILEEEDELGTIKRNDAYIDIHVDEVLNLPLVNVEAIKKAKFRVVVDGVNSTGGIAIPRLLEELGVETTKLYCDPTGHFPHNPEPLKEHLTDLSEAVKYSACDFGIVVDPDVDRLAFMDENGEMFGEEYTLVACADYVLSQTPGNTVSNMSSTRALSDVTAKHGGQYEASAVGEVNVVELMKKNNAIIGGEGNGGIIYPELHYGRDALVGVALFLSLLADKKISVSALRALYPNYFMSKKKIDFKKLFASVSSILYIGPITRPKNVSSLLFPVTTISICVKAHVSSLTDQWKNMNGTRRE